MVGVTRGSIEPTPQTTFRVDARFAGGGSHKTLRCIPARVDSSPMILDLIPRVEFFLLAPIAVAVAQPLFPFPIPHWLSCFFSPPPIRLRFPAAAPSPAIEAIQLALESPTTYRLATPFMYCELYSWSQGHSSFRACSSFAAVSQGRSGQFRVSKRAPMLVK